MKIRSTISRKFAEFGDTMSTAYSATSARFHTILSASSSGLRKIASIASSKMSALFISFTGMLSAIFFFSRREKTVLTASDTPNISTPAFRTLQLPEMPVKVDVVVVETPKEDKTVLEEPIQVEEEEEVYFDAYEHEEDMLDAAEQHWGKQSIAAAELLVPGRIVLEKTESAG